jgi:hypothetical protein
MPIGQGKQASFASSFRQQLEFCVRFAFVSFPPAVFPLFPRCVVWAKHRPEDRESPSGKAFQSIPLMLLSTSGFSCISVK